MHGSYSCLGRDIKSLFEELFKHFHAQKAQGNERNQQLDGASNAFAQSTATTSTSLTEIHREVLAQAAADRQALISQITDLISQQGDAQDRHLGNRIAEVQTQLDHSKDSFEASKVLYNQGVEAWNEKERRFMDDMSRTRDNLKSKLKDDWNVSLNLRNPHLSVSESDEV